MEPIKAVKIPKNDDVFTYSDPRKVQKIAYKLLGEYGTIYRSTKKTKKYMIYHPIQNKFIHFGQMGYEDYSKHNDELRRERFQQRNKRWSQSEVFSPSWLSYYLLW